MTKGKKISLVKWIYKMHLREYCATTSINLYDRQPVMVDTGIPDMDFIKCRITISEVK